MSFRSNSSSLVESPSGSVDFSGESIEAARERTDSDLKSEEILCNYGDNVVLDEVSEDAEKPVSQKFFGQMRLFAGNRIVTTEQGFDISPIGSEQSDTETEPDSEDSSKCR